MIAAHEAGRGGILSIRVESEKYAALDDLLEVIGEQDGSCTSLHGWQVKQQLTPLPAAAIHEMLASLREHTNLATGTLAVPGPIEVEGVASLRVLRGLCKRLGQRGVDVKDVLSGLRGEENTWLEHLGKTLALDATPTATLLSRFRVKFIGDEETLRDLVRERLETRFRAPVDPLVAAISEFLATVDGTVEVTYGLLNEKLLKNFPRAGEAEFDDVYRMLIARIDDRLWLHKWARLTDTLVRNLIPTEFVEDVYDLSASMLVQPWPGRQKALETAMQEVAKRARSFVDCFVSNSELADEKVLRENLAYKRRWDHAAYARGRDKSERWDTECGKRLSNLVVALNGYAAAVRATVNPRYRMVEGDFLIVDSLGVRNDGQPARYFPKEFREEIAL